jgi:hypothetical protein
VKKGAANEKAEDPKPFKIKQSYTIRDVINQKYRYLVEAEIPGQPSDKGYIGCYQRALTTVYRNMSEDNLKEAEEILESWNNHGPPTEVQLK